MNSLKNLIKDSPTSLLWLGTFIAFILTTGLGAAILSAIGTSCKLELFSRDLCITNKCVEAYLSETSQAFIIAKATLDVGVATATIGGIFVALASYFNTANNTALTNHIEHLKVFTEYIESEIKKRERLNPNLIDTLLLYGTIFNQSRNGKTTVSNAYKNFIIELNNIIIESNKKSISGTPGGFSYKEHQRSIRDHIISAGITVYTAPRNDYFEMEDQLFSLLHRISQSFCPPGVLPALVKREYH
jgi:hypothetical protein